MSNVKRGEGSRDAYIAWDTIGGDHYHGIVLEVEQGVAKVLCDDGVIRSVELD
jgi:hypothetical protein